MTTTGASGDPLDGHGFPLHSSSDSVVTSGAGVANPPLNTIRPSTTITAPRIMTTIRPDPPLLFAFFLATHISFRPVQHLRPGPRSGFQARNSLGPGDARLVRGDRLEPLFHRHARRVPRVGRAVALDPC